MLSKIHRLTKKKEFDLVREKGKSYRFKYFTLQVYNRKDKKPSRFGFIISKKVSPHAVLRNKVKRGLAQGVRQHIVYIKDGLDCVFVANPQSARAYTNDLMIKVTQAFDSKKLCKSQKSA